MLHSLIRTGAALVGLAGFAFVGPAHGDAEIEELQRAFPTTEWPPSMRKE